jgi:hypothetical protein
MNSKQYQMWYEIWMLKQYGIEMPCYYTPCSEHRLIGHDGFFNIQIENVINIIDIALRSGLFAKTFHNTEHNFL